MVVYQGAKVENNEEAEQSQIPLTISSTMSLKTLLKRTIQMIIQMIFLASLIRNKKVVRKNKFLMIQ